MNDADRLQELTAIATGLVDDLDGQRAREAAEFRAGYELGFAAGREVGWGAAEADMEAAWTAVAEKVRRIGSSLSFAQLEARRYPDKTPNDLARLRGRDQYPLPERECAHCHGTGVIPGAPRDNQEQRAT